MTQTPPPLSRPLGGDLGTPDPLARTSLPSGPSLSMDPTVYAVLITGASIGEPILSLHAKRTTAVAKLREQAAELLQDRLDYVPLAVSRPASSEREIIDTLYGAGIAATIGEERVSL